MRRIIACLLAAALTWTLLASPAALAANSTNFSDTTKHWARNEIATMAGKGYIKGFSDNTFCPDKPITRAGFIYALIQCMGYKSTDTTTVSFSDTKKHWARAQINEAVKRRIIIPGEYKNGFGPDGSLKRSEAAAFMIRALGRSPETGLITFQDKANVEKSVYCGYILAAFNLGLVSSHPDGQFKPFDLVSRAQACIMLTNLMTKSSVSTVSNPGQSSTAQPSGGVVPNSTRITTLAIGGYKYNPEYVYLYINGAASNQYLSNMVIIDQSNVLIGGKTYNLSTSTISVDLSGQFYNITGIYYTNGVPSLSLTACDPLIYKNLTMGDIYGVYLGDDKLSLKSVSTLIFIIDNREYDLSNVVIDASGNFAVNNKIYSPNQVTMLIRGTAYKLETVKAVNNKIRFNCSEEALQTLVKINGEYHNIQQVKLLKDNVSYPLENVLIVSKNVLRLGGKQFNLSSDIKCQYDSRVFDIDNINYIDSLNTIVMETTENQSYYGAYQPAKYTFYLDCTLLRDGEGSTVYVYAKNGWRSLSNITVSDPAHFTYDGTVCSFIGANIKIESTQFIVTDTVWRGKNQIFEVYLEK